MAITRAHLDALLSRLVGRPFRSEAPENGEYDDWGIFPAVRHAFRPEVAWRGRAWLWWSATADAAFGEDGVLTRPVVLHWRGVAARLQIAAEEVGLCLRLVEEGDAGQLVLSPAADEAETDLGRALRGFEILRGRGCVALPATAWTQSSGWSDVAGVQTSRRQTAIFWTWQGHEAFDALGMLQRTMCLYWRGSRERIAKRLREAGLTVVVPESDDLAFEITSSHPAPEGIATLEAAEALEPPLPAPPPRAGRRGGALRLLTHSADAPPAPDAHAPGWPVSHLWWAPGGDALLVAQHLHRRGSPEIPLALVDPATFTRRRTFRALEGHAGACGGAAWLPDGRLLIGWRAYDAGQTLLLVQEVAGEGAREVLRLPYDRLKDQGLLSVDAAGAALFVPNRVGVTAYSIGAPGARPRRAKPGVRVRRRRDRGPRRGRSWSVCGCPTPTTPTATTPSWLLILPVAGWPGAQTARAMCAASTVRAAGRGGATRWSATRAPDEWGGRASPRTGRGSR